MPDIRQVFVDHIGQLSVRNLELVARVSELEVALANERQINIALTAEVNALRAAQPSAPPEALAAE